MRLKIAAAVATVVLVPLAAGCGGGGGGGGTTTSAATTGASGGSGGGSATTLHLAADPGGGLKFDKSTLQAKAGKVTIDFTNMSSTPHNVTLEGSGVNGVATDTITSSKASVTADLKPGTYTFFCSVDGHAAAGMKGTLTVK